MKKKPTGKHSLFTEVGITYIQGRTFERRIELANETVALQRQPLEIKGSRYRSGKLTQLGISESQATLTNTQAYMPDLESSLPPLTLPVSRTAMRASSGWSPRTSSALTRRLVAGGSCV